MVKDILELVEILKQELYITWDDEATDKRLTRIVGSAIQTMNHKIGSDVDYTVEGMEQNLFINYCVYAYNGCVNEFDTNYFNEIMQVRQLYEVLNYDDEK